MAPGWKRILHIIFCALFWMNCQAQHAAKPEEEFFETFFKNNPGKFDSISLHHIGWNVQIIYTRIDRGNNGVPSLQNYYFNQKDARYFYPASTVKLPIAILALQKLHELPFPGIDMNSSMITEAAYSGQTAQYNDPNTADGRPTIAQYIKEVLLVSDNNAFNRLYEFLGQDYINKQFALRGYTSARILHRLDVVLNEDENRHTNPVSFYNKTIKRPLFTQPMQNNGSQYEKRNDFIGKAYYSDTVLVNSPKDFSQKNRMSLEDLHNILISLVFPEKVKPAQRFNITEEDRRFLLKYMSQFPGESLYPSYDSSYNDAWAKLILYGKEKGSLPKHVRVFNKEGDAYGQLTDIAYVVDFDKKIEFLVSATIYCNKDEILNDDKYDYDTVGLPFLKNLGEALYEYELKRKRNNSPDLSPLIFNYDK